LTYEFLVRGADKRCGKNSTEQGWRMDHANRRRETNAQQPAKQQRKQHRPIQTVKTRQDSTGILTRFGAAVKKTDRSLCPLD